MIYFKKMTVILHSVKEPQSIHLSTRPSAFVIHVEYTFNKSIVREASQWTLDEYLLQILKFRIIRNQQNWKVHFFIFE